MDAALARHSSFHETEIIKSLVSVITSGGSRGARPGSPTIFSYQTQARIFFFGGLPPPPSFISGSGGPGLSLISRCGFIEHCTTYAYCYSFFHFLFISVLSVVHHAVSLLVSAAFTDGTVRSSLLQQSNFKPWLQQLVLLAKEVTLTLFARRKTCEIVRQSYHAVCCPFFGRLSMR